VLTPEKSKHNANKKNIAPSADFTFEKPLLLSSSIFSFQKRTESALLLVLKNMKKNNFEIKNILHFFKN
tara:strand:+ start:66 stop:272 length:207 start_codon:yes stop_codon:yes gene_type:complete